MASSSPVLHPSALARLARQFYTSTVTIQQYTATQDTDGAEVKTWANLAGHIGLACKKAVSGGNEVKRPDGTIAIAPWRIAINGIYTAITPKMRAVVSGIAYNVLSVQHDSHANMTSLDVEVVT